MPTRSGRAFRTHLIEDVRIAQDLGIRLGDSIAGRIWNEANRSARQSCTDSSFAAIARMHGVSRQEITSLIGTRDHWLDILLVFMPMIVLLAAGNRMVARRLIASYDVEDRRVAGIILLVLAPVLAGIGLVLAQIWAVVVESLRLGSEHISYRAAEIPLYRHRWIAYGVAVSLGIGIVLVELGRTGRTPKADATE